MQGKLFRVYGEHSAIGMDSEYNISYCFERDGERYFVEPYMTLKDLIGLLRYLPESYFKELL